MVDIFAYVSRCTVKYGAHHIPTDGLRVEAIVVPNDDAALASQQFEGGFSVFFHALVVVVAIDEDHVILAKVRAEVEGLGVAVELFHVAQILAEEAVQVSVELVAGQFDDVFFR